MLMTTPSILIHFIGRMITNTHAPIAVSSAPTGIHIVLQKSAKFFFGGGEFYVAYLTKCFPYFPQQID